jgi:hypothetical protein
MSLHSQSSIKKDSMFERAAYQTNHAFVKPTGGSRIVQVGTSSLRNMVKQKSVRDLRLPLLQMEELKEAPLILQPVESEIDEGLSRINESEY